MPFCENPEGWGQVRGARCSAELEIEISCRGQGETFYGQPSPCAYVKFLFLVMDERCFPIIHISLVLSFNYITVITTFVYTVA